MTVAASMLIGAGTILVVLGIYFLWTHYHRPTPNEELEWMGYGKHPFRDEE